MPSINLLALAALLLAHGPHPSPWDAALIRAVNAGAPGMVRRLLALGADARARTRDGNRTPALNVAVMGGNATIVRLLLAHGADVKAADEEGNTALSEAAIDIGDGHYGRAEGLPIVQALLAHGADPRTKNSYGYTPVMLADDRGPEWLVRLLKGAKKRGP